MKTYIINVMYIADDNVCGSRVGYVSHLQSNLSNKTFMSFGLVVLIHSVIVATISAISITMAVAEPVAIAKTISKTMTVSKTVVQICD